MDPECVAAVQERFGREWAQVEARGGCVTTGDETTIEDKVDSANGALVDALDAGPPASRCSAGKFKDAGKKAACELFCAANAALHGRDVDPRCDTFCAFKFAVGFKVDEFRHDCHTRHDADQIESAIDAFVDDVIAELPFSGTTTTTVPSTTSTTVSTTSTTSTTAVTTTTSTTAPTTTSTAPTTSTTMVPTTTTTTSSSTTTTTLGSPSAAFLDDPLGG